MARQLTTFHYVDLPYFNSDCAHYKGYTASDFGDLLGFLSGIKGKFLLSSYPSEILTEYSVKCGWSRKEVKQFDRTYVKSVKWSPKIEVLTANYAI